MNQGDPKSRIDYSGLSPESANRLMVQLRSNAHDHDEQTKQELHKAFEPLGIGRVLDSYSKMSDDQSYQILSKCKIGSAVMLPYILNPQWKVD